MKKYTKLTTAAALFAGSLIIPSVANADWILLNDFEAFSDGEDVEGLFPHWTGGGALPYFTVYSEDINDPTANKGYFADWGDNSAGGSDTWVSIPLEDAAGERTTVEEGNLVSAYFRLYTEGDDNRWHFGATNKYGVTVDDPPVEYFVRGWSEHMTILRYSANEPLSAHSGGYKDTIPPVPVNEFFWREFWMLIDNNTDPNLKKWRVYYRDPGGEITPLIVNPDAPQSLLNCRNTDSAPVTAFVIATNNTAADPNPREFFLVDDIYWQTGAFVGDPRIGEQIAVDFESGTIGGAAAATWGDYTVVDDGGFGWVDTGAWMGWLLVEYTDESTGAGWVYSSSLGIWIYFPAAPEGAASGSWAYFAK